MRLPHQFFYIVLIIHSQRPRVAQGKGSASNSQDFSLFSPNNQVLTYAITDSRVVENARVGFLYFRGWSMFPEYMEPSVTLTVKLLLGPRPPT